MSKTLNLVFKDAGGNVKTVNIKNPKDGVTKAEATTAMNSAITNQAFVTSEGVISAISEIKMTTVEELE